MFCSWAPGTARIISGTAAVLLLAGCGVTAGHAPLTGGAVPTTGATTVVVPAGPQLGYIWSPGQHNLFPLLGIPGAAHLGSGMLSDGTDVISSAVSGAGGQFWALLLTSAGTLEEERMSASTTATVTTRVPTDATITFSPSGSSAVVASSATGTLVVVSGLPAAATVSEAQLPAGSALAGVAVSDGGVVLAGFTTPGVAGIQVNTISAAHGSTEVATVGGWGGAAFAPGTAAPEAVLADSATAQLTAVSGLGGTSTPSTAAIAVNGLLKGPVGAGISPDGKWVYVADSGNDDVVRAPLPGNNAAPAAIACACTPQRLVPIAANGLFAVNTGVSGQPLWLLDAGTAPRTFFVPAPAVASGSQTSDSLAASSTRTAQ